MLGERDGERVAFFVGGELEAKVNGFLRLGGIVAYEVSVEEVFYKKSEYIIDTVARRKRRRMWKSKSQTKSISSTLTPTS